MKIFGIMVVKNEADIITHTLRSAMEWCDAIYVLDNGSEDGTWEIVKQLAHSNPAIVAHERSSEPFTEFIRARLFNVYRQHAQDSDWWCRLDADEIYIQSPRAFLANVASHEVVWATQLQYYFTDVDLVRFNDDPKLYDPSIPLTHRYHYYQANWSEIRFFRHRRRLRWEHGAWPRHLGRVFPKRILLRHYQFRSPAQIQKRLATRSAVFDRGGWAGEHWRNTDWKSVICRSGTLEYDSDNGTFIVDEKVLPCHTDPPWGAAIKKVMHGTRLWP
jgi:glycosyltransferase involved in cell wall biosynthesis